MISRRALLAGLAVLLPASARAKTEQSEFYAPLQPIAVEFWDRMGMFHLVNVDLTVVYAKEGVKVANKVADHIAKALAIVPWEEFTADNPAVLIKRIALEVVKADPVGAEVKDVLIAKLLVR